MYLRQFYSTLGFSWFFDQLHHLLTCVASPQVKMILWKTVSTAWVELTTMEASEGKSTVWSNKVDAHDV